MYSLNIIVAFSSKNFGIGNKNTIPWNIPEDLAYFKNITHNSVVIMGSKTWESLPDSVKPLKNRLNIVVSSRDLDIDALVIHPDEIDYAIDEYLNKENVFIIGGESLYRKYIGIATNIYTTHIHKNFECDRFFPIEKFGQYEINAYEPIMYSEQEKCKFQFIKYVLNERSTDMANYALGEQVYLDHMRDILDNGCKREDRTGTGTLSLFAGQIRFDISNSIPMLTTKFVPIGLTLKELLFFLKGSTNTKELEAVGVNIWSGNTTREFLDARGLLDYNEGDMGPMYFWQIFHMGAEYKGCNHDYTGQGYNQMEKLLDGLKNDPWSRRHLLTTYSPVDELKGVLAPCHGIIIQFYYSEKDNKKYLSCHVYIRSSDGFLGLPINILSYSILTYIIAKKCGYLPLELIISFGDRHIYLDHIDAVKEQLTRSILPLPKLKLNDSIIEKEFKDIKLEDFELIGYISHPKIAGKMAI